MSYAQLRHLEDRVKTLEQRNKEAQQALRAVIDRNVELNLRLQAQQRRLSEHVREDVY